MATEPAVSSAPMKEMNTTPADAEEASTSQSSDSMSPKSDRPACFNSTLQEFLVIITTTMAIAMSSTLMGAVTVISPFVGLDLHMTTAEITWIGSATSLSSGAFLMCFGKLADLFGRKSLFIGSMFLYSILALGAGFANTPITLDVLTGVLGLLSASATPAAVGILGTAYDRPSKRKNIAFACFSAGNPLGCLPGMLFGGVATNYFGWRAAFWAIAIMFIVFTIIGFFTLPKDGTDKEPLNWVSLKKFDIVGSLLTIGGIGMFSAALSLGPTAPQGWKTSYVLAFLIISIAMMVAFVFWELWYKFPLIPMGIWKDRNFSASLAILMLGYGGFTPSTVFISLYWYNVKHMSPLMIFVHFLPILVSGVIVNVIAGLLLHRVSNKLLMLIGAAAYFTSNLLLALQRSSDSYWAFAFPALTLIVVGADLEFNVANMYVMSTMPKHQQSIAGGVFQTAAKLSMTLGLGIATAIFNSVQKKPEMASYWDKESQPYSAAFWASAVYAGLSVCLVPLLTLGSQGGVESEKRFSASTDVSKESTVVQEEPDIEKSKVNAKALDAGIAN